MPVLRQYLGFAKLANILWTNEPQRRLDAEGSPIIAISVHPGSVNTFAGKLPTLMKPVGSLIMKLFFKHPDEGAYNSVIAAASRYL
jgi:hypothetical protein